jgi:hypothetical protein
MQAKSTSDLSDEDRRDDSAVLELLVGDDHPIWSETEVALEMGKRIGTVDAVVRLHGAGLIHRLEGGFVFASRAAVQAHGLR